MTADPHRRRPHPTVGASPERTARLAGPTHDIAGAALYLASDDAAPATGQAVTVDAGLTVIRPSPAVGDFAAP
jgi:NAD(P)-dependent dehydrogenase (short-subunit alcohol dehydrogenase family)